MSPLMSYITDMGAWSWLILGAFLFVLEAFVPGVFLVWFGFAAMVTGAIAFAMDIGWQSELLTFVSLAVVSVVIGVKYAGYGTDDDGENSNLGQRGERYLGQEFVVEQPIRNGRGKVRLGDTLWPVKGKDANKGDRVRVTGVDGNALMVEAAGEVG